MKASGVKLVGISMDDKETDMPERLGLTYPIMTADQTFLEHLRAQSLLDVTVSFQPLAGTWHAEPALVALELGSIAAPKKAVIFRWQGFSSVSNLGGRSDRPLPEAFWEKLKARVELLRSASQDGENSSLFLRQLLNEEASSGLSSEDMPRQSPADVFCILQ